MARRSVEWCGERYTVEPLNSNAPVPTVPPVWAVSRRGEFIGTLPAHREETTKEFEARCTGWLKGLLGAPSAHQRRYRW